MGPQPFRFLDLPLELRLMVYERIPRYIKHTHVRYPPKEGPICMTLVHRAISVSILATCRAVHEEGKAVVERMARTFISNGSPRLIYTPEPGGFVLQGLFEALFRKCRSVAFGGARSGEIPTYLRRQTLDVAGRKTLLYSNLHDLLLADGTLQAVEHFIQQAALQIAKDPAKYLEIVTRCLRSRSNEYSQRYDPEIEAHVWLDYFQLCLGDTFPLTPALAGFLYVEHESEAYDRGGVPDSADVLNDGNRVWFNRVLDSPVLGAMDQQVWAEEWLE